ncbi:MAG TPA: ABC transporter permease [Candidatus Dormibacteraeota bacterium]|nr:ABC transporter permease [Candidatus Dormibacteraeota bacterium]
MKFGKELRFACAAILCILFGVGLCAGKVAPYSYAKQFRERTNAAPSASHLLGTDSLGRDLFARLVYGTRVSLLLAPAAALLSTLIAGIFGGLGGLMGGWCERLILAFADLSMALPLLFVLLALRALLPLDISPVLSVIATFILLGLLGWPSSLRVVWAATRNLRNSDFLLLARATGCGRSRMIGRHVLPNLRPVLFAQFWISIPLFVLTEATLSMLGLGVMEPLPSWGNLLRGLEDISAVSANPWRLSPLLLLVLVVICFQLILPEQEETT